MEVVFFIEVIVLEVNVIGKWKVRVILQIWVFRLSDGWDIFLLG